MKRSRFALAAVLVLGSACAQVGMAQDGKSHDGNWVAQYPQRKNDNMLEAVVVLRGSTGTWNVTPPSVRAKNPCLGRDYPVTVVAASGDSIELAVHGSKALTGCSDLSVKLKRIDETTLEGLIDDTRKVTLKRQ